LSASTPESREPYPIYRALRVPVWEKGGPVNVRPVTDDDRKKFRDAIANKLRPMLERLLNLAETAKEGKKLTEDEKLELIADAIVTFLRAPLIQEISPQAPTPLKAHSFMLLPKWFVDQYWNDNPHEFVKELENLLPQTFDVAKELFDPETTDLVFNLWIAFPADTRPGHNTSSLIAHSLMTSAIAWALNYESSEGGRPGEDPAVIRLVALLHDLGKVEDPLNHPEASKELARQLLEGLVSEGTLDKLLNAIERHHFEETVIKEADRLSSAADRVNKLVELALGEKISKIKEILGFGMDERAEWKWDFWKAVHQNRDKLIRAGLFREDPLRELTEEFLQKVDYVVRSEEYHRSPHRSDSRIKLALIDIASIQEYVLRGQEIRVIAAASHIIELAVHAHFYWYLRRRVHLPPEAVIYSGGGNILLLLPSSLVQTVKGAAEEYGKKLRLKLIVADTDFVDDYVLVTERFAKRLHEEKHRVSLSDSVEDLIIKFDCERKDSESSYVLCQICYKAWGTESLTTAEGVRYVCCTCSKLYEIGTGHHFSAKWRSEIKVGGQRFSAEKVFGKEWEEVSKWIMEIIAGHDPDELEKGFERRRDYAVVKFDANALGRFMLESVSFTDAIERSFRVDMAVKRAYFRAMEALYEGVKSVKDEEAAKRETVRVFLGTVFMGGDDGILLMPSWASVPFAHLMAEEFSKELGLERGLRVAIAAGPAAMSVWSLLDCAQEMMNLSKQVLRREDPTAKHKVLGSIAFDVFESGSPSGATARDRMERLSVRVGTERHRDDEIDSLQPYLIRRSDLGGSTVPEFWRGVGKLVLKLEVPDGWGDHNRVRTSTSTSSRRLTASPCDPMTPRMRTPMKEWVKGVRDKILRSWPEVSPSRYWREKLIVYFLRQKEREGERKKEDREAYEGLADLGMLTVLSGEFGLVSRGSASRASFGSTESQEGVGPFPLADVLTFIKLAKGGAQ
jgi:5'-deoxynucleotidase YfbR-like HD superfamily hydrolase